MPFAIDIDDRTFTFRDPTAAERAQLERELVSDEQAFSDIRMLLDPGSPETAAPPASPRPGGPSSGGPSSGGRELEEQLDPLTARVLRGLLADRLTAPSMETDHDAGD